jgi:hypothetical protein
MPRSITQTRRAHPYCRSILARNVRSVEASGKPSGVTTNAITTCGQSGRLSRL